MADPDLLSVIENEYPDRNTKLEVISPEFTCLCPGARNQPDFGTITIEYVPDEAIIELKSLKLYLTSYRDDEIFHEPATNQILDHLISACHPRWMRITGQFNVRGGISTDVVVEHGTVENLPESPTTRMNDRTNSHIQSER
jgi:7-cyano-7-deazaguanine reductase